MNKYLIDHRVKKFLRSPTFDQSVLTAIWVGLVALYLVVVIGVMGMFLPEILQGVAGDAEQVGPILSRVIIYYMIFDLVIRYFFQKLPGMDAKHYILLPIRKNRLVRFLLNISVFNLFNFFGLLLVLPFFYRVIRSENELWSSIAWLLGMLSIIAINHFTAILIKRWGTLNFRPVLITAALIALLLSLEYFGWISIMSLSASIFTPLLHSSVGFAVLVLATIGLYWWNTKLMLYFIYEDRGQVKTGSSVGKNRLAFLVNRGITGTLVLNEIRLILRNKRAKSVFLGSLLIPVAFLVYFSPETSEVILVFLPFAIIAIGAFA
nr:hypothetical protein [Saprospiraceae bacterium]